MYAIIMLDDVFDFIKTYSDVVSSLVVCVGCKNIYITQNKSSNLILPTLLKNNLITEIPTHKSFCSLYTNL